MQGAELTRAYANRYGARVVPGENAIPLPHAAPDRLAAENALGRTVNDPAASRR